MNILYEKGLSWGDVVSALQSTPKITKRNRLFSEYQNSQIRKFNCINELKSKLIELINFEEKFIVREGINAAIKLTVEESFIYDEVITIVVSFVGVTGQSISFSYFLAVEEEGYFYLFVPD